MGHLRADTTQVLLLRHGQTDWNLDGRMQGQEDVPLNADGRAQAAALAAALSREQHRALQQQPPRPEALLQCVISSDLARAQQTAEAIAAACQLPLTLDAALRERHYGHWQGLSMAQVQARWPHEARAWHERDPDAAPAGGESLRAFTARCLQAWQRHVRSCAGQAIAIVTHGGVLDVVHRHAVGLPLQAPRRWVLPNAAINRLRVVADGRIEILAWADVAHLSPAAAHDDDATAGA